MAFSRASGLGGLRYCLVSCILPAEEEAAASAVANAVAAALVVSLPQRNLGEEFTGFEVKVFF